jgi:hypothetical protein
VAALSIAQQDRLIRAAWPTFRTIIVGERLGIWRGSLQGLSHSYEVEIVYARNRRTDPFRYAYAWFPEVTVLDPPLSRRAEDPDDPIPHVYNDPDRDQPILCLFDPRADGWGRHQPIADTILVWAAGWLRFYEAWQATGIWTGGSAPHGPMTRPAAAAVEDEQSPVRSPGAGHFLQELLRGTSAEALSAALADHDRRTRAGASDQEQSLGGAQMLGVAA